MEGTKLFRLNTHLLAEDLHQLMREIWLSAGNRERHVGRLALLTKLRSAGLISRDLWRRLRDALTAVDEVLAGNRAVLDTRLLHALLTETAIEARQGGAA